MNVGDSLDIAIHMRDETPMKFCLFYTLLLLIEKLDLFGYLKKYFFINCLHLKVEKLIKICFYN